MEWTVAAVNALKSNAGKKYDLPIVAGVVMAVVAGSVVVGNDFEVQLDSVIVDDHADLQHLAYLIDSVVVEDFPDYHEIVEKSGEFGLDAFVAMASVPLYDFELFDLSDFGIVGWGGFVFAVVAVVVALINDEVLWMYFVDAGYNLPDLLNDHIQHAELPIDYPGVEYWLDNHHRVEMLLIVFVHQDTSHVARLVDNGALFAEIVEFDP